MSIFNPSHNMLQYNVGLDIFFMELAHSMGGQGEGCNMVSLRSDLKVLVGIFLI